MENTKWYTIQVQPNKERSIGETIKKEVDKGNAKGVVQTLVPIEITMIPNKDGKLVKKEKVLYSGYVFVEVTSLGELQYVIKNINGANSLLKDRSGNILPIHESEIKRMKKFMKSEEEAIRSTKFYVNEKVIITSGAFDTFKGTITEVIKDVKAKVNVSIFGRPTEIEIDLLQLKKCTD